MPRCTARVTLPKPGGSTSTLLTLLLAFVRSFADDQPTSRCWVCCQKLAARQIWTRDDCKTMRRSDFKDGPHQPWL